MLPSGLDAQFGTPYPRSAGFDTDIGAFIESSSVSSPLGLMDPTIINSDAVQGGTFLGMEGKLEYTDVQVSYHCNRLYVTLTLSGVYINRRVFVRRTTYTSTIIP